MATTTTLLPSEPEICEAGGGGLLLPIFANEHEWPNEVRGILYGVALGWHFLGVSIIADIFMSGIEAVTSKRTTKTLDNGQTVTIKVWNGTVANLTLMALGSSAPEILLNVIEILSNSFHAGALGPSTIIGSAAFNMLMIMAICIVVIPSGEARTISQTAPFLVTAFFSVFAYLWLILVLGVITPDYVDVWEGVMTFLWFPILVVLAYLADIGIFDRKKGTHRSGESDEEHGRFPTGVTDDGQNVSANDARVLQFLQNEEEKRTRAARRADNVGAKAISPKDLSVGFLARKYCFHEDEPDLILEMEKTGDIADEVRVGIAFQTRDGNMKSNSNHYSSTSGFCEILPGQRYGQVKLPRDQNDRKLASFQADLALNEMDEDQLTGSLLDLDGEAVKAPKGAAFFFVDIVMASKLPHSTQQKIEGQLLGRTATGGNRKSRMPTIVKDLGEEMVSSPAMKINILPNYKSARVAISSVKDSGRLRFDFPQMTVPGPPEETPCHITVRRFNGSDGELRCNYRCEADTAKAGYDYLPVSGELVFGPGVASQEIVVPLLKKEAWENADKFYVIISNVPGYPPAVEEKSDILNVLITADKGKGIANAVMRLMDKRLNLDAFNEGNRSWSVQIRAAFHPTAGDEDEDAAATPVDWAFHIVALPWKVVFALVPPAGYCEGWLCFFCALAMVGAITAMIGDLAGLLGCVMGLTPGITAVTIVAVGTSLPDAFASKAAAVEDETADNAIGNVTGSNSVNVFLGIGLPWMAAAIFWSIEGATADWKAKYPDQALLYPGGGFIVIAGDLVFTVIVFSIAAVACLCLIWHRRRAFQAELGGPDGAKTNAAIFLVFLWLFYVGLAVWKETAGKTADIGGQLIAIVVGCVCIPVGVLVMTAVITAYRMFFGSGHAEDMKKILEHIGTSELRGGSLDVPVDLENMSTAEIVTKLKNYVGGLNALTRALETSLKGAKHKVEDEPDADTDACTVSADTDACVVSDGPIFQIAAKRQLRKKHMTAPERQLTAGSVATPVAKKKFVKKVVSPADSQTSESLGAP